MRTHKVSFAAFLLTANILRNNPLKIYFIRCYAVKRVQALKAIKGEKEKEKQ